MLSTQVREGLEAEVVNLRYEQQRIEDKIKAIQAVLAADEPPAQQRPLPIQPQASEGPLSQMGLREAMKAVLVANPGGLRTGELVAKIEEGGYTVTGKLALSNRVYAEINRLNKSGRIARRKGKSKRWVWVDSAEAEPQEEEAG